MRFDKMSRGPQLPGFYVEKGVELGAAIMNAFASCKPTVIYVPIERAFNDGGNKNLDTPN